MRYSLTLTRRSEPDDKISVHSIDVVQGTSMSELLAHFLILIASIHRHEIEELKQEKGILDDDIPF